MISAIGFPPGTVYPITNITNAMPGVVTLASIALPFSFPVAQGQTVTISKVKGMSQVNDERYIVANFNPDALTFQLYDIKYNPVDTRSFNAYASGGQMNIISYDPPAGQPPGLMYNNQ
jgi:hypothetical protein